MENYEHVMKINPEYFELIKAGKKTREYRLYDGRRRAIQGGDIVTLKKLPDLTEEIKVRVIRMSIFATFYDMYNEYFNLDFKDDYNNVQEIVDETYEHFYSKEDEETYGCVALEIELID